MRERSEHPLSISHNNRKRRLRKGREKTTTSTAMCNCGKKKRRGIHSQPTIVLSPTSLDYATSLYPENAVGENQDNGKELK